MLAENLQLNLSVLKRFALMNAKKRLAHAYLFIGPAFSYKSETAKAIAQLMTCEANNEGTREAPCGKCSGCLKATTGNHPDIHFFEVAFGETIKIETARQILEQTQFRPFEAERKVFILKNAESLTMDAANALLKTLEEPSATSLLILTTSQPDKILGTIKSRCHTVYFTASSTEDVRSRLQSAYKLSESDAHFLSYFAEGCLGKAVSLNDSGFIRKKDAAIDEFILSRDVEAYLKKTVAEKEQTRELLDVLLSWVRDAILLKSGVEEDRLIHKERMKDLKHFVSQYTFTDLKDLNDEIIKANKLLADNLNIKVPLLIIKEKLWVS